MVITEEEQKKIKEAIAFCENAKESFLTCLKGRLQDDSEQYEKLLNLIVKDTYFAGECFRSFFNDEKTVAIDVYFSDQEAATIFKDFYLRIKSNRFLNYYEHKGYVECSLKPNLRFHVEEAFTPEELLNKTPISARKHYYHPFRGVFNFDLDTFLKHLTLSIDVTEEKDPNIFFDVLFLYRKGYEMGGDSLTSFFSFVKDNFNLLNLSKYDEVFANEPVPDKKLLYRNPLTPENIVTYENRPKKKMKKFVDRPYPIWFNNTFMDLGATTATTVNTTQN